MPEVTAGQTTLKGRLTPLQPQLQPRCHQVTALWATALSCPWVYKPRKKLALANTGLMVGRGVGVNANPAGHQVKMREQKLLHFSALLHPPMALSPAWSL